MMCGQLMQTQDDNGGCTEELSELPVLSGTSQMRSGNDSGMCGITQQPVPLPSYQMVSVSMPYHTLSQSSRPALRYHCTVCPKGFRSKLDVERHIRTHTGEKPFTCPYCPHRSATKGNLKAHVKHIHANIQQPLL